MLVLRRGLNKFYGDADISAKLAEDVLNVLMVRLFSAIQWMDEGMTRFRSCSILAQPLGGGAMRCDIRRYTHVALYAVQSRLSLIHI